MKDDLWCVRHASEYVATKIIKGSRPYTECIELEFRMKDIEDAFRERFGTTRGNKLIAEMEEYNI